MHFTLVLSRQGTPLHIFFWEVRHVLFSQSIDLKTVQLHLCHQFSKNESCSKLFKVPRNQVWMFWGRRVGSTDNRTDKRTFQCDNISRPLQGKARQKTEPSQPNSAQPICFVLLALPMYPTGRSIQERCFIRGCLFCSGASDIPC